MSKKDDFMIMKLRLLEFKGEKVKVEKTKDYYNAFLSLLRAEDDLVKNNKHYWIMALDKDGYVLCVYIFAINPHDLMKISLKKIFRITLMLEASKVVVAYNTKVGMDLIPSSENIAFFNKVFNFSDYIDIEIADMMVISEGGYHSDKEDGYLEFYRHDLSFKMVYDVKDKLHDTKVSYANKKMLKVSEKALRKGKKIGIEKGRIEIAKIMIEDGYTTEKIAKYTGLDEGKINKLRTK